MKLKLSTLLSSKPVLEYIYTQRLTAAGSYLFKRNIGAINPELTRYQEAYNELLKKYGESVEGKEEGYLEVPSEDKVKFLKELESIITTEFELDILLISIQDLTCKLSPAELELIDWMIGQ